MVRRILVTGATGLIGSHLRAAWNPAEGDLLASSPGIDGIDLLTPGGPAALLDRHRPDAVVHLAWCASGQADYRNSRDNRRWLEATLELWGLCRSRGVRLSLVGTPLDRAREPKDAYSAAKSELLRHVGAEVASGELAWLRPFYVFDPDAGRPRLVAQALAAKNTGSPLALQTGAARHDFIHAADVGSAIALATASQSVAEVDIGSGTLRRVDAVVKALGLDPQPPLDKVASAHPSDTHTADTTALRALGWRPTETERFFHDS